MAGPKVGEVVDGYRFKGGDPNAQGSWEQVAAEGSRLLPAAPFQGDNRSEAAYWSKARSQADPSVNLAQQGVSSARRAEGLLARQEQQGQGTGGIYGIPIVGQIASFLDPELRELDAISASAARQNRQPGEGAISDFDAQQFVSMTYGRDKPLETNRALIQAQRTADDAAVQKREFQEWFFNKYRTTSGSNEAWRAYAESNPIFSPESQQDGTPRLNRDRATWREYFTGDQGLITQAEKDARRSEMLRNGELPIDEKTGLPTYSGINAAVAGVSGGYDIGPDGNPIPPPDGPQPGDVSVTTQVLAPEDTPASLAAQGYVYDPARDTWSRSRQESVLNRTDWTPEGAVAQRREMWNPARQVDAFVRGAADATSLEFADEIAAGADALVGRGNGRTLGDRYRNNVRVQRAIDRADGEDAGFARNAGEVAGYGVAALTQGPRLLAQGARRFGSPLLNGAVTGIRNALTGGAIAGTAAAGAAEGNALQRAQEALKAAPVGAAAGVVTPVAVNALAPRIAAPVQAVNRFAGRQIGRLGEQLGVPGAARLTERATPSALASAVEQYGARIGDRRVSALADNVQRQRDLGFQPTLADAVDDAGQGQIRALASIDTPARDRAVAFGRQRRAGAQEDVSAIARRFVSDDPRTATRVARDLEDAQTAASGPAYEAARASPPITVGADIGEALFSGEGPSTIRAAGRAYKSSVKPEERALALELEGLAQAADEGVPAGDIQMSVGAADLLSRYLNKAGGNDANLSRIYQGLGRAIRRTARDQSPAYDAAVSGYAERAQLDDATDFGRRFLTRQGSEDFANEAAAMLPAQRDVARVAARDTLEDAGSTPGGAATLLDNLAIGRGAGQRGDALIPEAGLMRDTAEAARMRLQTGRNVDPRAGSNTNLNRQDTENVDSAVEFLGDGARIIASPLRGTIDVVARRFQNRGFNRIEAEELVNAALDPTRTDDLVRMLSQRMTRKDARTLARAVQRQVSSGSGSSSAEQ